MLFILNDRYGDMFVTLWSILRSTKLIPPNSLYHDGKSLILNHIKVTYCLRHWANHKLYSLHKFNEKKMKTTPRIRKKTILRKKKMKMFSACENYPINSHLWKGSRLELDLKEKRSTYYDCSTNVLHHRIHFNVIFLFWLLLPWICYK